MRNLYFLKNTPFKSFCLLLVLSLTVVGGLTSRITAGGSVISAENFTSNIHKVKVFGEREGDCSTFSQRNCLSVSLEQGSDQGRASSLKGISTQESARAKGAAAAFLHIDRIIFPLPFHFDKKSLSKDGSLAFIFEKLNN